MVVSFLLLIVVSVIPLAVFGFLLSHK
jgi:hypothetical protein